MYSLNRLAFCGVVVAAFVKITLLGTVAAAAEPSQSPSVDGNSHSDAPSDGKRAEPRGWNPKKTFHKALDSTHKEIGNAENVVHKEVGKAEHSVRKEVGDKVITQHAGEVGNIWYWDPTHSRWAPGNWGWDIIKQTNTWTGQNRHRAVMSPGPPSKAVADSKPGSPSRYEPLNGAWWYWTPGNYWDFWNGRAWDGPNGKPQTGIAPPPGSKGKGKGKGGQSGQGSNAANTSPSPSGDLTPGGYAGPDSSDPGGSDSAGQLGLRKTPKTRDK